MILRACLSLVVAFISAVGAVAQGAGNTEFGPLLVSSNSLNQILSYDPIRGGFLGIFSNGGNLGKPQGVAFGPDGNLYVASGASNQILRFQGTTGILVGPSPFASVQNPVGITFGPDGNLYVVTNTPDSVIRFNGQTGAPMGVFASASSTNGLEAAFALAFGPDGNLYVTSTFSGRVLRFNGTTGQFMDAFAVLPNSALPSGLVFSPGGDLLVADIFNAQIHRFDVSTGTYRGVFATLLNPPSDLAIGPGGDVYVASPFSQSIVRYDKNGSLVDTLVASTAYGPGQANFIAFAPPLRPPTFGGVGGISAGVVNAASFDGGTIVPGEFITIFGGNLGPVTSSPSIFNTSTGKVSTYAAGTRVLFDGIPGPIIYTQTRQVSVAVPYEVAGAATTHMQVEYLGQLSPPVAMSVTASMPGIFTIASNGVGQGAIINADGITVNSAANPAPKGSTVSIYATGAGQMNPAGVDGVLAPSPSPLPVLTTTATIGGQPAQVVYSGGSQGQLLGLLQVNIVVPPNAPSGPKVPVSIAIGGVSSQPGVTMSIQ